MNTMLRTLAAVMILAASEASAATGDWPQYGFTAAGRRENTQETILTRETVPHLVQKWSAQIDVNPYSAPAVANGMVYVARSHHLYALDARTGALVWNAKIGLRSESSPAVADGVVYVGSLTGIHAFDAERARCGGRCRRAPRSLNADHRRGRARLCRLADAPFVVSAKTGIVKWTVTNFIPHSVCAGGVRRHCLLCKCCKRAVCLRRQDWSFALVAMICSTTIRGCTRNVQRIRLRQRRSVPLGVRRENGPHALVKPAVTRPTLGIAVAGGHIYVK